MTWVRALPFVDVHVPSNPRINIILFILTVLSTIIAGSGAFFAFNPLTDPRRILDGVPDADGQPANGSEGVRIGLSKVLAMNPDGTSSSGTLYMHGRERSQYAVRVFGATGRVLGRDGAVPLGGVIVGAKVAAPLFFT